MILAESVAVSAAPRAEAATGADGIIRAFATDGRACTTLICGSIAYDTIMVFPGRFKEHILPEKLHILNVAFLVPDMRREFGGCAGNIAYNLKLLGGEPLIMATVGDDCQPYAYRLDKLRLVAAARARRSRARSPRRRSSPPISTTTRSRRFIPAR